MIPKDHFTDYLYALQVHNEQTSKLQLAALEVFKAKGSKALSDPQYSAILMASGSLVDTATRAAHMLERLMNHANELDQDGQPVALPSQPLQPPKKSK